MPGGATYLKVAQNTYDEVWAQWDTSTCGGGIYWSRDRTNAKSGGFLLSSRQANGLKVQERDYKCPALDAGVPVVPVDQEPDLPDERKLGLVLDALGSAFC